MDKQVAVAQPYHGHARRKRHTERSRPETDEWTVYDPETRGDGFESVQWLVCVAAQGSTPTADQLLQFAARTQQRRCEGSGALARDLRHRFRLRVIEGLRVHLQVRQSLLGDYKHLRDARHLAKSRR